MMRLTNLATTGTVALALSILACSSTPPANSGSGTTEGASTTGTGSSTEGGGTPAGPAGTPATPAGTPAAAGSCAAQADADSCETCCDASTDPIKQIVTQFAAVDAKWKTCACAPAVCATACATDYCAAGADPSDDATAGSACEKCLDDNTDACDTQTEAEYAQLQATPGAQAQDACYQTCSALPGFDPSDLDHAGD